MQIGESEDALSLLLGSAPDDVPRGKALDQIAAPPQLPPGLPSSLIERRPDIRQAEQNLIAANAQIGAARALLFPQISLTGLFGGQSRALTSLFTGPARMSNIGPSALIPIFHAGLRSGVRLTEAQQREALITYEKTIYGALREVSDAFIVHDRTREQRIEEEKLVTALTQSVELSTLRYRGGLDSYLQVLDAERNLFGGPAYTGSAPASGVAVGGATVSRARRRLAVSADQPAAASVYTCECRAYDQTDRNSFLRVSVAFRSSGAGAVIGSQRPARVGF